MRYQQRWVRVLQSRRLLTSPRAVRSLWPIALLIATIACDASTDTRSSSPVRVAVLDTGVSRTALLAPVLDGRDHLSVLPDQGYDDHDGHGTRIASLIHLQAPRAQLVSVKAIGMGGHVTDDHLAEAIRRAVQRRANIVVLAVSGAAPLPLTRAAIVDAGRADVLVVVAAGNNGLDLDAYPAYPAVYDEENMVVVAATNDEGLLLGTSNRSSSRMTLALASGLRMPTCAQDGTPTTIGGTSAASALIAARAAELLAVRRMSMEKLHRELLAGGSATTARPTAVECRP